VPVIVTVICWVVPSLARNLGLQHSDSRVIEAETPVYVSGV
jgi:hypothetical protein